MVIEDVITFTRTDNRMQDHPEDVIKAYRENRVRNVKLDLLW